jgi:glyoxylase-like metal-dependent hydrolase (beta-lactamase superfamily II)
MAQQPEVVTFFDEATYTASHLVIDAASGQCAIIDPVLDYDPAAGRTSTTSAERIVEKVRERGLTTQWILETHVHADHLTAAPFLQRVLGGRTAIGSHIGLVQETFASVFNAGREFACDGSQFDHLFIDGETFQIGELPARAMHTPGHTPACMSFLVGDAVFVGDTLFMPDYGTARCDFPGGDAGTLYQSVQRLYELPGETRMFLCHDYLAPGRDDYRWQTTVKDQRDRNVHLNAEVPASDFIDLRQSRDAQLGMPQLILPSVQVNMRAGKLPPPESNGVHYLKIPVDLDL